MRTFIRRPKVSKLPPEGAAAVPAAAYVRMSTDHQRYSVDNQLDAINGFAERRGFEVVEVYADLGKSGVTLQRRTGLQKLLQDVDAGDAPFRALLVYDVSRWGRFQDPDESASYELKCRRAGIAVHYCVEPFENDGSLSSSVMKAMKRAMAGEYSRDLSARVFRGQARVARMGYRLGGRAGLGYRRMMVDENGQPRCPLAEGEYKALSTNRVVLVLGPPEEVNAVRRVFRLFVCHDKSELAIMRIMNAAGAPTGTRLGRWTPGLVDKILRNEKYIGNQVWGRISIKLRTPAVANPADQWIRCDGAYPGIVSARLFERAQAKIRAANIEISDEGMLEALRGLLTRRGYLSGPLIESELPFTRAHLRYRFGGLLQAYHRVGYQPRSDWTCIEELRLLREFERRLRAQLVGRLRSRGCECMVAPYTHVVEVADGRSALVRVIRAKAMPRGLFRWFFSRDQNPKADLIALACTRPHSSEVDAFYIIPRAKITRPVLRIGAVNARSFNRFRLSSLDPLAEMLNPDGARAESL